MDRTGAAGSAAGAVRLTGAAGVGGAAGVASGAFAAGTTVSGWVGAGASDARLMVGLAGVGLAGVAFAGADLAAGAEPLAAAGGFSLILRTTGASMVELADLTNSPCSFR